MCYHSADGLAERIQQWLSAVVKVKKCSFRKRTTSHPARCAELSKIVGGSCLQSCVAYDLPQSYELFVYCAIILAKTGDFLSL